MGTMDEARDQLARVEGMLPGITDSSDAAIVRSLVAIGYALIAQSDPKKRELDLLDADDEDGYHLAVELRRATEANEYHNDIIGRLREGIIAVDHAWKSYDDELGSGTNWEQEMTLALSNLKKILSIP